MQAAHNTTLLILPEMFVAACSRAHLQSCPSKSSPEAVADIVAVAPASACDVPHHAAGASSRSWGAHAGHVQHLAADLLYGDVFGG